VETLPSLQNDPSRAKDVLKVDAEEDGVGGDEGPDGEPAEAEGIVISSPPTTAGKTRRQQPSRLHFLEPSESPAGALERLRAISVESEIASSLREPQRRSVTMIVALFVVGFSFPAAATEIEG